MPAEFAALGVVVVNYGTHHLLVEHLADLADHTPDAQIVVVDNYSTQIERESIRELVGARQWLGVYPEANLGFGGGVNAGAKAALASGAEALLILNPDASIDAHSLSVLREALERDPKALISPRVLQLDGSVWFAGNDLYLDNGRIRATRRRPADVPQSAIMPWLSGACLMVSKDLWERVGGFNEEFFMYWEDVDFSYRATRAGGRLVVEDAATAVHDAGGSQTTSPGDNSKSPLYYYYNIRNRLLFAAYHVEPRRRRAWRRASIGQGYQILLRGGRRHLVSPRSPWSVAVKATRDGLRLSRPRRHGPDAPLTVMLSFPPPRPTTNPYAVMLAQHIADQPDATVRHFSWRSALGGRYDVFHAHWPEILVGGSSPAKKLARQVLFAALLTRLSVSRVPWVRTVHNLGLPSDITRREQWLLRWAERLTTLRITINPSTPLGLGQASETILHGDYEQWFSHYRRASVVPGRVAFFGAIRQYKGVPSLLTAFRETTDETLSLHVVGKPSTIEQGQELEAMGALDSRITLGLDFVEDSVLVDVVSRAELVALPYHEMHNSGAALAALSLQRPVLLPNNDVNRCLAEEVGRGWIHTYDGDLSGAVIEQALARVRSQPPVAPPDFRQRGWDDAGRSHVMAYRRAVGLRTGMAEVVGVVPALS